MLGRSATSQCGDTCTCGPTGVYLQARMEEAAECMLVLIGATSEGKKELVGFPTGVRERVRRAGVSSLSTSSSVGSRLRLRGKSRGSFIGYRNSQPLTVFPSVSTSLAETSTATMVASLPIRKLASLANLTSSVLGDPRAEATTSRARPSFWAHTCTTASSLTSNTCSCMIMVGPPPVCPVQLSNSGFVNSVTSRDTRIFLGNL